MLTNLNDVEQFFPGLGDHPEMQLFQDGAAWTEALSVFNLSLSSVINSLEGKNWIPLL